MGQSLFQKHSKFQKFDEMLYCEMTRFRNVKLGVYGQYQNTKIILEKKNMGQNRFKNLSEFQKFQLSNFTLTVSNEGKTNSVRFDMTYSKELQQENENFGQTYRKNHLNYTVLVKYCVMAISRNINRFLMGIGRSISQKGLIKVHENTPIQL